MSTLPQPKSADHIVDWVEQVLRYGVEARASDVHFEPTAQGLQLKLRLDGVLTPLLSIPKTYADNVVSRLKVLAGLLTYRNDIPQEGRLSLSWDEQEEAPGGGGSALTFDQRLSVFPTIHGQRAVLRIFYEDQALTSLDALGLPGDTHQWLRSLADAGQGVLLLTGPAGSGKSTTLAALLRDILARHGGRSVITVEDPVERHIEGATQIQIPPHGELTFASALRSLLRQDPEVLMLGEVRDAETARLAIEAGLTGHFVMTTMHSGAPTTTLLRLLEMGIPAYQVTSSVEGVVNQRLVRRLCRCKGRDEASGEPMATGCDDCYHTGYAGRVLLAERMALTSPLRQALLQHTDRDALDALLAEQGHQTLLDHALVLLREESTDRAELQRVCGPLPTPSPT